MPQVPNRDPKISGSKMIEYLPSSPCLGFRASLAIVPAFSPALVGSKSFSEELHSTP